jgi:uncharacterized protein YndB with AHSA1/START domain
MIECQVASKAGDSYRWVWRHNDGRQFGIGGVCREIVAPERIVKTELMDGYSDVCWHGAKSRKSREAERQPRPACGRSGC